MTSPIDPIRNTGRARRTLRPRRDLKDAPLEINEGLNLPVVAGPVINHEPDTAPDSAAIFSAQLLGQDGQKRGLRSGPKLINAAHTAYVSTEWSGPVDRRSRKGAVKKTDV